MHGEHYAGVELPVLRHGTADRALYITLLISIVAHLLFWQQLDVGRRPISSTTTNTTFAVTLLPSPKPVATQETPPRPATPPRREIPPPPQEQSTTARSEVASNIAPESVADATAVASEPLSPPRHDAAYLHNPEPNYPLVARRRHLEGTVVIRAQIGIGGECLHTELQRSSGHAILDQAALDAVGQWRFVPARRGSETVVAWVDVPITFHLTEER